MIDVQLGDCVELMAAMDAGSVHAVVCDPPYGINFMGKAWDGSAISVAVDRDYANGEDRDHTESRARAAAMHAGEYDLRPSAQRTFQAWTEAWGREALRVLKPGGHALVFGGTRTYHRMACGLEDAGFEIRDCLMWLYGSGFPKSLDVSKAIDKRRDDVEDVRVVCRWLRASIEGSSLTVMAISERFGFHSRMVEHWAARDTDSQPTLPTLDQWDALRDLLGFDDSMDAEVLRLNLRKGEPGASWADRPVTGVVAEWENRSNYALTSRDGLRRDTAATPEAARWEGWGTALKPAWEPVIVARKPLGGTVAGNVLAHGTGALNIDGCRTEGAVPSVPQPAYGVRDDGVTGFGAGVGRNGAMSEAAGRWPANVVLDEAAGVMLDEQTGELPAGVAGAAHRGFQRGGYVGGENGGGWDAEPAGFADSGGASRFFYCAKTSSAERNAGLDAFELGDGRTMDGGQIVSEGRTASKVGGLRANVHPTVKPVDLMRWLVRLVTPPGGLVLDPFTGSGSTGIACALEGFDFVGLEREPEYVVLARARIAWWERHRGEGSTSGVLEAAQARHEVEASGQLDLLS